MDARETRARAREQGWRERRAKFQRQGSTQPPVQTREVGLSGRSSSLATHSEVEEVRMAHARASRGESRPGTGPRASARPSPAVSAPRAAAPRERRRPSHSAARPGPDAGPSTPRDAAWARKRLQYERRLRQAGAAHSADAAPDRGAPGRSWSPIQSPPRREQAGFAGSRPPSSRSGAGAAAMGSDTPAAVARREARSAVGPLPSGAAVGYGRRRRPPGGSSSISLG